MIAGAMMAPVSAAPVPAEFAQVTIQQTLIIKRRVGAPKPLKWKEKKGPKCVALSQIAGAAVVTDDAIDLVTRDGDRLRARFSSNCPALDYYSGFYMKPTQDGRICSDRDVIRTRSGAQCEIERFRKLVPKD
ncbi:hypothetical protein FYJ91_04040 [Sphingomonas montanisoli]|uniref:Uncharacterized protein n=2 Tax=Sphingomonas montanisoli TaxID=2606412 RepID=A0A5D9CHS8_9SPHN|nr:hypothetical protein FYJ91_04040 [Sphingomonas montanisoli]